MIEQFVWEHKYRPRQVKDVILPKELKTAFQQFVDQGNSPNLILTGSAGVGKTSIAKAMLDEMGCDYITINGSLNGNIDTLRVDIANFASSVSFTGGRKYVIIDEADYLNANSTQPALRGFIDEFSGNCGFIFTCNYIARIIEPIQSRCSTINFRITASDRPKLAAQFFKRVLEILDAEGVKYEPQVVAEFINKHFPDNRRILNELQRYSASGPIDTGILSNFQEASIREVVELIKQKDFKGIHKWVVDHLDNDPNAILRGVYDVSLETLKPQYTPILVILVAKYQQQGSMVADQEVNLMAFFAELLVEGIFQ